MPAERAGPGPGSAHQDACPQIPAAVPLSDAVLDDPAPARPRVGSGSSTANTVADGSDDETPWYRGASGTSQTPASRPASSQSVGSSGGRRTERSDRPDLEPIVESPPLASARGSEATKPPAELSVMHACMHCRAAKTACTDERPCRRCTRLGLECSAYRDEPRKRACVGCHTAKVSCSFKDDGSDTCARCRRLGITCVPRDNATIRGVGVRKKRQKPNPAVGGGVLPLELLGAAEAAKQELSPKPKCATTSTAHVSVAVSLLHLAEAAMGHEELSSGDSLPTVVADSGGEGASLARPLDAVWQHPVWGQYAAAPAAAPTN